MANTIVWPTRLLTPTRTWHNLVPFSRSGGRSLGGVEKVTRTDLGYWSVTFEGIPVRTVAQERTWNAIRSSLAGRSGLIIVPGWYSRIAPYGAALPGVTVTHSDGSTFSDGTSYSQRSINVETSGVTALGATSIKLKLINAEADLVGTRFSHNHALYEISKVTQITGNFWTVNISPSIRVEIASGEQLDFDRPSCICHLATESEMDASDRRVRADARSISFTEATDYWSELAA